MFAFFDDKNGLVAAVFGWPFLLASAAAFSASWFVVLCGEEIA
jgi:hypothetical protein